MAVTWAGFTPDRPGPAHCHSTLTLLTIKTRPEVQTENPNAAPFYCSPIVRRGSRRVDPIESMEFWGVEVKPGQSVKCEPEEDKYLHLSQASLGESKGKENVPVFVKINDQKLVLGTLSVEKCAQMSLDLVFEKEFELSHTSKNTSVFFCGYKSVIEEEQSDNDDYPESESEPEDVPVGQNANGKPVVKPDQGKPGAGKANAVKEDRSAAKKAKKAEPAKADKSKGGDEDDDDDEDDEDDSSEESESEDMAEAMSDSDDEDEDESSEEEDDATPKKAATAKRPAADSASKTPAPEKKAKIVTPAGGQKTGGDGKKNVHVATPHPAKKAGKTPGNGEKSKQQSPKSAGSVTCKSCSRTFNSDNALQAHTKAKHG